jgi:precorrin-3B synthase
VSGASIKGWCPGALQPMRSGDGLVVRVRPRGGRIDAGQARGLAELASRHGNGLIELTNRANLQIRGVSETSHRGLIEGLARLSLLDEDLQAEARRNVLVAPFWNAGDEIVAIAEELERALALRPAGLPNKFGFAVDCGRERVLAGASADIRIERDDSGQIIVRADGAELGRSVEPAQAVECALALAEWFVASGGVRGGRGRMAAHIGASALPPQALAGATRPARSAALPCPGIYPQGAMFGVAFGQMTHAALAYLGDRVPALRVTPWRMVLAEGMSEMPGHDGFITEARDPMLRVEACSGAPRCRDAHADTRTLAAALAPRLPADARLHVSGCAKGCARAAPASFTLVATGEGFDLIRCGSTRDRPVLRGLSGQAILADPAILSGGR